MAQAQMARQFEMGETSVPVSATMALDWNGPNDPDNPRNFSLQRRAFSTAVVTALAFTSTLGGAIYAPAQEKVATSLQCSYEVAILPLSLYNLGLAFGPLIGAPLSEIYGRKAVFLMTTPIFALFILSSGFSSSIEALCICRFFAGMFASPNISNASATILDSTVGANRGISLGAYYTVPSAAAVLGPVIGGLIVLKNDWRWTQWTTIFMAATFYIPVFFTKETYKKVVLQRRAQRLGQNAVAPSMTFSTAVRHFTTTLVKRPLHMLCTETVVTLVSLYNGFIFALMYTFVVAIPSIFQYYYDFDMQGQALVFLGLFVGAIGASAPLILIDMKFYRGRLQLWQQNHHDTPLPPEVRLMAALIGSFLLPTSLFLVAWTAQYRVHWVVPVLFQALTMLSSLLIYASVSLFMMDVYGPLYGASASGAMQLMRYLGSATFPLFALQMYKRLGVGWATSILAFLMVLMAPTPWCFWVYGERLRKRSKYETSD